MAGGGSSAKLFGFREMEKLQILQEYLELDPKVPSGLRWKKSTSNSIKVGEPAGSCDSRGYYKLQLLGHHYKCHRIILLLNNIFPPEGYTQVDHIDRNPSNNLISNLRWATPSLNTRNCKVTGEIPYRYVRRRKSGRFESQYKHPITKEKIYVGVYVEAIIAYKEALAHRLENHWI